MLFSSKKQKIAAHIADARAAGSFGAFEQLMEDHLAGTLKQRLINFGLEIEEIYILWTSDLKLMEITATADGFPRFSVEFHAREFAIDFGANDDIEAVTFPLRTAEQFYGAIKEVLDTKPYEQLFSRSPDVRVTFRFNGNLKSAVTDGYRPAHRITERYLTTGLHRYDTAIPVPPDGTAEGTITFLMPQAYPHSLWKGKIMDIHDGLCVVGQARVIEVYNPILKEES